MSSSSKKWLERHRNDAFVKKANKLGLRSRAAFKLMETQEKYKFIKPKNTVVDLGSAPGSWSEACTPWLKDGKMIACDILNMPSIPDVTFIQGDFNEPSTRNAILDAANNSIDVIISDMSPNKTGIKKVDQWQASALSELVLLFATANLKHNGNLFFKCFHGDGFDDILKLARKSFCQVKSVKPAASRKDSTETYLLCLAKKAKAC